MMNQFELQILLAINNLGNRITLAKHGFTLSKLAMDRHVCSGASFSALGPEIYRSAVIMFSKKSSSVVVSTRSQGVVASFWATIAVVAAVLPTVCNSLGYQASNAANQAMTCGPVEDALEYLLWLLRNV